MCKKRHFSGYSVWESMNEQIPRKYKDFCIKQIDKGVFSSEVDTSGSLFLSCLWWSSRIQMEGTILRRNRKMGGEILQDKVDYLQNF